MEELLQWQEQVSLFFSVTMQVQGQVWSWGEGQLGQLGHSDTTIKKEPTLISALEANFITHIACGDCIAAAVSGILFSLDSLIFQIKVKYFCGVQPLLPLLLRILKKLRITLLFLLLFPNFRRKIYLQLNVGGFMQLLYQVLYTYNSSIGTGEVFIWGASNRDATKAIQISSKISKISCGGNFLAMVSGKTNTNE